MPRMEIDKDQAAAIRRAAEAAAAVDAVPLPPGAVVTENPLAEGDKMVPARLVLQPSTPPGTPPRAEILSGPADMGERPGGGGGDAEGDQPDAKLEGAAQRAQHAMRVTGAAPGAAPTDRDQDVAAGLAAGSAPAVVDQEVGAVDPSAAGSADGSTAPTNPLAEDDSDEEGGDVGGTNPATSSQSFMERVSGFHEGVTEFGKKALLAPTYITRLPSAVEALIYKVKKPSEKELKEARKRLDRHGEGAYDKKTADLEKIKLADNMAKAVADMKRDPGINVHRALAILAGYGIPLGTVIGVGAGVNALTGGRRRRRSKRRSIKRRSIKRRSTKRRSSKRRTNRKRRRRRTNRR